MTREKTYAGTGHIHKRLEMQQLAPRKPALAAAPAAKNAVPYFPPLPSIQEARPHRSLGLAASIHSALLPDVEAAGAAGGGRTSAQDMTASLFLPVLELTSHREHREPIT